MTATRRKKNSRMRAGTTHGYGSMKKHRGAGSRGGRGVAGTGKRADVKKSKINPSTYFGKSGFTSKSTTPVLKTIPLNILQNKLFSLLKEKKIKKSGDSYVINLEELGYQKLLSKGTVHYKLTITTSYASKKAVDKIVNAGGTVSGLIQEEETPAEETPADVPKVPKKPVKKDTPTEVNKEQSSLTQKEPASE